MLLNSHSSSCCSFVACMVGQAVDHDFCSSCLYRSVCLGNSCSRWMTRSDCGPSTVSLHGSRQDMGTDACGSHLSGGEETHRRELRESRGAVHQPVPVPPPVPFSVEFLRQCLSQFWKQKSRPGRLSWVMLVAVSVTGRWGPNLKELTTAA